MNKVFCVNCKYGLGNSQMSNEGYCGKLNKNISFITKKECKKYIPIKGKGIKKNRRY